MLDLARQTNYTRIVLSRQKGFMIKKEINGIVYFCFETSEEDSKKAFETALLGENSIEVLVKALVKAITAVEISKKEAWESVRLLLPEPYNEQEDIELTYNWVTKGFTFK